MRKIHFVQLRQILKKLAFKENWVKGSHVVFNNPQADALIILSSHPDYIGPAYLRMVEKVLKGKSIMKKEQFERIFHLNSILEIRQSV